MSSMQLPSLSDILSSLSDTLPTQDQVRQAADEHSGEKPTRFITVNGAAVPIFGNQTNEEATDAFLAKKGKKETKTKEKPKERTGNYDYSSDDGLKNTFPELTDKQIQAINKGDKDRRFASIPGIRDDTSTLHGHDKIEISLGYEETNSSFTDFEIAVTRKVWNELKPDLSQINAIEFGIPRTDKDGGNIFGAYSTVDKTLAVNIPANIYKSDQEYERIVRSTLAHELAHAKWQSYPQHVKDAWTDIVLQQLPLNSYVGTFYDEYIQTQAKINNINTILSNFIPPSQYEAIEEAAEKDADKWFDAQQSFNDAKKKYGPDDPRTKELYKKYNDLSETESETKANQVVQQQKFMKDIPKHEHNPKYIKSILKRHENEIQSLKEIYANEYHSALHEIRHAGVTATQGFNKKAYKKVTPLYEKVFGDE